MQRDVAVALEARTVAKLLADLEAGRDRLDQRSVLMLDETATLGAAREEWLRDVRRDLRRRRLSRARRYDKGAVRNARRELYVDVTRARENVTIAYGTDDVRDFGDLLLRAQRDNGKIVCATSSSFSRLPANSHTRGILNRRSSRALVTE